MTEDLTIRPATPADLNRFRPLYLGLSRYSWGFRADRSGLPPALTRRAAAAGAVLAPHPDRLVLLALSGVDAVGYVVAGLHHAKPDSLDDASTVGSIDELFVDPAARGSGAGRRLLDAADAWFRERAILRVRLEVFAWNEPALAFYRHAGFEVADVVMTRDVAP